ncbi:FAD/NAD(P)-binding domain-containing protein [Artomyces pyxidatus]|uniref:FAD/NAD(P)-binding domain-containing protein n=1 Tax=Artomyces pyxidatus TaxID=48021 RepID=A0ACB8SN70_9AGAM|nr:FAD/NAD(P)-binding domain-containing protein [Artomyces pyxidatus]
MKVLCIGAGYSGIVAGIRFSQKVPNLDLTIYEKAAGIGGVWYANKYPGIGCDVPSLCYQLAYEEYMQWSSFYSPGHEILAYLRRIVDTFKLMRYIRLSHELVHARWDESTGKWRLRIRRVDSLASTSEEFEDDADVLFLATGAFNRPSWPKVEGLNEFQGRLVHSALWDVSEGHRWEDGVKDWGEKSIGVIGNGSSGIQIVAALQPRVASIFNFVRSPTWISGSFAIKKLLELLDREPDITDLHGGRARCFQIHPRLQEIQTSARGRSNPVSHVTIRGSEQQKALAKALKEEMTRKLASKPGLAEELIPDWSAGYRRLTPGAGYLEALCEENAVLETTPIARITPAGVALSDGSHRRLDVLICATGFDMTYQYPFPVLGRDGRALSERWDKRPEAYLAIAVDGFPNMFLSAGPNSGVNAGSLLAIFERQVLYAVSATLTMQRQRIRSMEVQPQAVRDWIDYVDGRN